MAIIFWQAAFIYLLPAAIFFWLSKDVCIFIAGKIKALALLCVGYFKKQPTHMNEMPITNESVTLDYTNDRTGSEGPVTQEPEVIEEPAAQEPEATEESAAQEPEIIEELATQEPEETEEPFTQEPEETEEPVAQEPETAEAVTGQIVVDEPVPEQMTVDETSPTQEMIEDIESAEVVSEASAPDTEAPDEPTTDETASIEPEPESATTEVIAQNETAQDLISAETPDKEPGSMLGSIKNNILANPIKDIVSKTKGRIENRRDVKREDERHDVQRDLEAIREASAADNMEGGFFDKVAAKTIFRSGHEINIEEEIKRQFDNLDMITTSAIAIMLSDTKSKTTSPYIRSLRKPDIRPILLKFCKDTFFATDIEQINRLFSKSYYKRKIARYFNRVTVFVKRGIGDTLPKRIALRKARITKNRFINKICESMSTFESVKFISALSGNEKISDSKRNYKLDHLSENYKDALIYLVDLLLTCTCIAKMLFVERMIRSMDENSEFKRIITNMTRSIDDHNLIISKSRPIYKQYYQSELGYINGDDFLYGMAITIMVNNVNKVEITDTSILQLSNHPQRAHEFKTGMLTWLDGLALNNDVADIGTLILQKIALSIKDNYNLLTSALQELTNWENYYSHRVAYYNKERDKERYLKGDFEKEKEELKK